MKTLCQQDIEPTAKFATFQPLGKRIVVKLTTEQRAGSLWIPESAQKTSTRVTVVAVGLKVTEVKVGDIVHYNGKWDDADHALGKDYALIQEGDVIAVEE